MKHKTTSDAVSTLRDMECVSLKNAKAMKPFGCLMGHDSTLVADPSILEAQLDYI